MLLLTTVVFHWL